MNIQNYFSQAKFFLEQKSFPEAIKQLELCIDVDSNFHPAYFELCKIYIQQGNEDKAKNLLINAHQKHPDNINISSLLSEIYLQNLHIHIYDLISLYENIIKKSDAHPIIYFRLSFLYNKILDKDQANKYLELAYSKNDIKKPNFSLLLQYEIIDTILFNFNFKKMDNFYAQYYEKFQLLPELKFQLSNKFNNWGKHNSKKIRLGFISGDFKKHSVNFFFQSLLKNIDKNKFEIFAFPTTLEQDEYTIQTKNLCNKWLPVRNDKSLESAQLIHAQNIDILFDLSGHTSNNGLLILKHKPAPIQVSWLGYFASTGIPEIDYFITSKYCVLTNEEKYFSEKILKLPETYLCYDFSKYDIEQSDMPYDKNGYFTFGFFQNLNKTSNEDFNLWQRILTFLPTSKLIIKSIELSQETIKNDFVKKIKHLPLDRIELRGETNLDEHLKQHNDIDIMLDACNVSGCTTTCQSLYMGVPILTFKGYSMLTRHGEQFLNILNLTQFILNDFSNVENHLFSILKDIDKLREIKKSLRNKTLSSSIGNGHIFTQQFEKIIEQIK